MRVNESESELDERNRRIGGRTGLEWKSEQRRLAFPENRRLPSELTFQGHRVVQAINDQDFVAAFRDDEDSFRIQVSGGERWNR